MNEYRVRVNRFVWTLKATKSHTAVMRAVRAYEKHHHKNPKKPSIDCERIE